MNNDSDNNSLIPSENKSNSSSESNAENKSNSSSGSRAENKMGTMPVNRLLLTMSLPMMASMLVQALYNIVDSIFVSRIHEDALSAVSMAFPIQLLVVALGGGIGVGVNAILSKALGSKDYDRANLAARNGIFLALVCYIIFLFVGIFVVKPFYTSITDIESIVDYGVSYLTICSTCSFGIFAQFMFERLLISTGRTFLSMITQGTGAIINIILDPILIFGYFGFPEMGVAGAAVATVIGQCVAALLAIYLNHRKNPDINISMRGFRPESRMILDILIVGIPSIIMQAIGSIMNYIMNKILIDFSSTATAVFGAYYKMQSFIFMPIFGLNGGIVPIIAYNYGAKRRDRMMHTWRLSWIYATAIMGVGTVLFLTVPNVMLSFFDASDNMMRMGITAFRIICVHFPIAAYCIVTGTLFQALGKSFYSMVVSIMRQLIALIPAALLLAQFGDVDLVWWAFPIAEIMSAATTTFYFVKIYRQIISKIEPSQKLL
ncbi:MAG: MATE family efflux transporter [Lachnospiraceae bacterium]|nr:MATE family efflux transporter [Lachnospiraceae bacterium]